MPVPVPSARALAASPPPPAEIDSATVPPLLTKPPQILSHQAEPFNATMVAPSSVLLDGDASSPLSAPSPAPGDLDGNADPNADVDPQIIEALKSKDRLFVLRLGDYMESLISERK